jgi:hypothetical protein
MLERKDVVVDLCEGSMTRLLHAEFMQRRVREARSANGRINEALLMIGKRSVKIVASGRGHRYSDVRYHPHRPPWVPMDCRFPTVGRHAPAPQTRQVDLRSPW